MNANASVPAILSEKHGIAARPGAKVECPFCHHKTFSIKRDDRLGKCFHPACGRHVTPAQCEAGQGNALFRILEEVFGDFHKALLDLREATYRNTYSYCVEERRIHPRVVADSMLGAVPSGYDVAARFAPHIEDAEAAIKAEDEAKKRPGRPRRDAGPTSQERLVFLTAARDKLANCIRGRAGWLAFFYTDAAHRVVAVRFREPYAKRIIFFKPTKTGGVFNHSLFTPCELPGLRHLNDLLLVVEGEFNQLQLQSLCVRVAQAEGRPPESGYVFACAVGGVNNADVETIRRLARTPVICYDHDTSGAGFALVETLRRAVTVTAFTTPRLESDLDDFIRGFGTDTAAAYEALKALVSGRKLFTRPYDALKAEIDAVRRMEGGRDGLKRFEVHRRTAEIVVADLKERGRFYHDSKSAYLFFFDAEKRLMAVERDNQDLELALSRYGLAPGEDICRHVLDALRLEAMEHGTRTEVYPFTHYNRKTGTLYLFDLGHQVYRITPDAVDRVDNGTDGVLFLHNPAWKPFTLGMPEPDRSAFDEVILAPMRFRDDGLTVEDRRLVFLIWFYSLFFPELFPTRPILALVGERGSGKTFALRKVGQLLFGPSFNVMQLSNDPKDFDAAVTHVPFVAVDNSDRNVPWLDDRLAVVATGGSIKRRELYTTNRLVEYPVRAFVGITSRTPYFRREDVADRLLIFYVLRFETFTPESKLLAELEEHRDRVMTEVVGHLQEIVRVLRDRAGKTYPTRFRMADFADFALRLAHAQGWGDHMASIVDCLAGEQ